MRCMDGTFYRHLIKHNSITKMEHSSIEKKLKKVFKPLGIIAYTNCCSTCYFNYADQYGFKITPSDGIWYFNLYLGTRVNQTIDHVTCSYKCLAYLLKNKEEQEKLIKLWCSTIGVCNVQIRWPDNKNESIYVTFDPLILLSL